ncbi:MAG: aspartyl protease family protein [Acidobacteriota bacterium]|nr:aspartyl protease family protein [Acidobacteriota bacterium]
MFLLWLFFQVPNRACPLTITPLVDPPPIAHKIQYEDTQKAMANLAFDQVPRADLSKDAGLLLRAVEEIFGGDPSKGESLLKQLEEGIQNQQYLGSVIPLRARLMFNKGAYNEMDAYLRKIGNDGGELVDLLVKAGPERPEFTADAVGAEVRFDNDETPEVMARIGSDILHQGIFDTGAGLTVVTESLAKKWGARLIEGDFDLGTGTSKQVRGKLATLARIQVGNLVMHNHHVIVMPDELLTLESEFKKTRLELIIGWNLIRHARCVIDYHRKTYSVKPSEGNKGKTNFFWMGYPLVKTASADGQPLLFGLDTGAINTSVGPNLFDKLDLPTTPITVQVGSVGGFENMETVNTPKLSLRFGKYLYTLEKPHREPNTDSFFVLMDGTLGSDAAAGSRMVIDFPAGRFELRPSDR